MHIFEAPEQDLLIINGLFGECLAKSAHFFYFIIFSARTAAKIQTRKLTKSILSAAEQPTGRRADSCRGANFDPR
jgi:hypothetical protein